MLPLRVFPNCTIRLSGICGGPGTSRTARQRAFFFAVAVATFWLVGGVGIEAQTPTNAPAATTNVVATPAAPAPLAPADVVAEAEAALAKLKGIASEPDSAAVENGIDEALKPFAESADAYAGETMGMLEKNPSLDQIRTLQSNWKFLAGSPKAWKDTLTKRAADLGTTLSTLQAQRLQWQQTQKAMDAPGIPPEVRQRIQAVLAGIDQAEQQATARQARVLALQDQVVKEDSQASAMLAAIKQSGDEATNRLFVANTVPIWKINQLRQAPATGPAPLDWAQQEANLVEYFNANSGRFFVHGAVFLAALAFFFWVRSQTRHWAQTSPQEAAEGRRALDIFETPVSNALLLTMVLGSQLYPLSPRLLLVILSAIALFPAVIILRRLIQRRLFAILDALIIFFFIQEFRSVETLPPPLGRMLFLAEMTGALLFLLWLLASDRLAGTSHTVQRSRSMRLATRVALVFIAIGLVANLLGFSLLGNLLCEAVQRSANLALVLYAGLQVVQALVQMILRLQPLAELGMVRRFSKKISRRVYRFFVVVAIGVWVLFALEMFSLRTPVLHGLWVAWRASVPLGSVSFSPGRLIEVGLLIWGAVLLSQLVRFVMECDIYPRLKLGPGLPYAISTIIHYAVLTMAILTGAAMLGLDSTKLALVLSALGVGIGLGLQNLVNNFVSGLVLLFERPIKIGDSIQVGDSIGVVERIGIRASVLKTTAGAELIVPNAMLISDRVTNWTFSRQERVISIPLNIARGPDVERVKELLIQTVATNPKVLATPAPQVLVLTLAATVNLELRVWTNELDRWNDVRSDLIMAVNTALARENVTVV